MKLNNKGYLIIEIVLASMIAFGVAYFLFDLTINLKNKSDDLQAKTIVMSDRTIVENYVMSTLNENIEYGKPSCSLNNIHFTDKDGIDNIMYLNSNMFIHNVGSDSKYKKEFNTKYAIVGRMTCNDNGTSLEITIPLTMQYIEEDFGIDLEYMY